ncbi:cytolytic toxin-alpha-like [Oppia nitens]|uniref:cytolytic toxin-alpha-like n=1 Tax=Oppia nitens TaxID=1686743 RepID=UPI0023DCBD31|nr:cytolytic toxin-alpha-like [Oppia nitens]
MDIGASLKMSILVGMIKIGLSGSAHFLSETKTNYRYAKVSVIQKMKTKEESININDESLKPLIDMKLLDKIDATHVVVGKVFGGNVIVSVENKNEENKDVYQLEGRLAADIKLNFLDISGGVDGSTKIKNITKLNTYDFKIVGDIIPDAMPVTVAEALNYTRDIPKLLISSNTGSGKIIEYHLMPINVMREIYSIDIKQNYT